MGPSMTAAPSLTTQADTGTLARGDHRPRPVIIQGGMGVAVSGWRLARTISTNGHLGVVSGTALDAVLARILQDGDPGGHYRRALAHFPNLPVAQRVLDTYFIDGGRPDDAPYRPVPKLTLSTSRDDLFGTVANLQTFTKALQDSDASEDRQSSR